MDGLQPDPVEVIARPQDRSHDDAVAITNVQYLASYNWTDAEQPTIIVPGAYPGLWVCAA